MSAQNSAASSSSVLRRRDASEVSAVEESSPPSSARRQENRDPDPAGTGADHPGAKVRRRRVEIRIGGVEIHRYRVHIVHCDGLPSV